MRWTKYKDLHLYVTQDGQDLSYLTSTNNPKILPNQARWYPNDVRIGSWESFRRNDFGTVTLTVDTDIVQQDSCFKIF